MAKARKDTVCERCKQKGASPTTVTVVKRTSFHAIHRSYSAVEATLCMFCRDELDVSLKSMWQQFLKEGDEENP